MAGKGGFMDKLASIKAAAAAASPALKKTATFGVAKSMLGKRAKAKH
jgi:hypothetical protein